jgi:hypothetical protein
MTARVKLTRRSAFTALLAATVVQALAACTLGNSSAADQGITVRCLTP